MAVLSSLIHGSRRSRQPVGVPTASRAKPVQESTCDLLPLRSLHRRGFSPSMAVLTV